MPVNLASYAVRETFHRLPVSNRAKTTSPEFYGAFEPCAGGSFPLRSKPIPAVSRRLSCVLHSCSTYIPAALFSFTFLAAFAWHRVGAGTDCIADMCLDCCILIAVENAPGSRAVRSGRTPSVGSCSVDCAIGSLRSRELILGDLCFGHANRAHRIATERCAERIRCKSG